MRNLVLAQKLQQKDPNIFITFATLPLKGNLDEKIKESGFAHISLDSGKTKELIKHIQKEHIDFLILDHYGIDYKKEKKIKQKTGVKLLCFDDTYEKHHCDILLNHNIYADKKRYKALVPKHCKILCGKEHTLLREEFYQAKKKQYKQKRKRRSIFVAMGGADHTNKNIKILKLLQKFQNIRINLVTTKSNKHLKKLKSYAKERANISVHINATNIAHLMAKSDFAIVTPSVVVNEVLFMEIPFIAIKTADNQVEMYTYLKRKKFLTLKSFSKRQLKEKLCKLLS